ncbi:TonB-dependent receptor [Novosphingobium sp. 9U]|nr:TonB-dependent receptor [Novosphingobium sp. 9U]
MNIDTYYYKYSNIQITQLLAGGTSIVNAAAARAHGVEFDTQFQPRFADNNLVLRFSGAYAEGKYKSFPSAPIFLPNPVTAVPAGVTCPAARPATVGGNTTCVGDLSGNTLIRMPEWSLSGGVEYRIPLDSGHVALNGDAAYSSSFFWEPANRLKNPANLIVNARIGHTFANDKVRVSVFAENLTKEVYYIYGAESGVGDQVVQGRPRMFGVELRSKIGG